MKSCGLFIQFCVFIILVGALLQMNGCLPDPKPDPNYVPSDEYRMNEVERKLEMLENNKNW